MIKPVSEIVGAAKEKSRCITPEEAVRLIKKADGVVILDVREPSEVSAGSIDGSINIPRGLLEMKIMDVCREPTTPLFIHCAAGARAALAACALQDMGFTSVYVIDSRYAAIAEAFMEGGA
ncbi:MAG: sulfurtransferase [Deltaproteobacteria bacterium]|nr:sulfurtransferase [Deltaproteobacteria bacterium]